MINSAELARLLASKSGWLGSQFHHLGDCGAFMLVGDTWLFNSECHRFSTLILLDKSEVLHYVVKEELRAGPSN